MSSDDTTKYVYINVGDDRNIKPLSKIEVETKAKTLLSQNVIMASDIEKVFCQDCLDFFVTAVQYLQSNMPYDVSLLQHAQYIYPDKCSASESLSAISNVAVKVTLVLNNNNCLCKVFGVKNASTDSIDDQVHCQLHFFQNEKISRKNGISWMRVKTIHQPQGRRIRIGQELKNCGIESTPVK